LLGEQLRQFGYRYFLAWIRCHNMGSESKGPFAYENWKMAQSGAPVQCIEEYPLFTDAHIIGEARDKYGPYQLLNIVPLPPEAQLLLPAIVLRSESYLVYDADYSKLGEQVLDCQQGASEYKVDVDAHGESSHQSQDALAQADVGFGSEVLKMHMLRQLREDGFDQWAKGVDDITLEGSLLFLIGTFGGQDVDALALSQTLSALLVHEALVSKDPTVSQVGQDGLQEIDIVGSSGVEIKEVRDAGWGHTQAQFEAIIVPVLASTVPPVGAHKSGVSSAPEELADRDRRDINHPHIFQVDTQLVGQKTPEGFNVATHIAPANPQPRLTGQTSQIQPIVTLSVPQDGRFTFQTTQISQQHQFQNQTVAIVRRSSSSFLVPGVMLAVPFHFTKQNLASTLM
jgi:hypothetical protein